MEVLNKTQKDEVVQLYWATEIILALLTENTGRSILWETRR